jgi:hypothetical protein
MAEPNTVSAPAPTEETQNTPVMGELQAPPAAPQVALASPAPAPAIPPVAATSPNKQLHKLVSSVFGALAGEPTPSYRVDATGRTVAVAPPPDTTGAKLRRIINTVGTGLEAGSQVGPQKSRAAAIAAGLGAGFGGEQKKLQEPDLLKRKQASEEFEQQEKAKLQQHTIASGLALTARNWNEANKLGIEMDPMRQSGIALANAAKEAGLDVKTMTETEWQAALKNNPELATKYIHVPAGFSSAQTDETGQEVKPGGGQITVIPATGDGNIALPQAFVDQISKYAPLSGRVSKDDVSRLPAGHGIPVNQLPSLIKATEEGRATWLEGEHKPTLDWTGPNQDQPQLVNSITHEPVAYMKPGVTPEAAVEEKEKIKAEAGKTGLQAAQTQEAIAKGKEALANAALAWQNLASATNPEDKKAATDKLMGAYTNLPPDARGFMQNLNPDMQATVLSTWAGRTDPKSLATTPRKGTGQMSRQQIEAMITRFDPTWRENKYDTVKRLDDDFINPKGTGGSIRSFNQFMQHAAEAKDLSDQLSRTNAMILNMPLNEARRYLTGNPLLGELETALTAAPDEWANFIKSGHAETSEERSNRQMLTSVDAPVGRILGALHTMGSQGVARLGEINETYRNVTGINYPGLVSPKAREAAGKLGLANQIAPYAGGGTIFTGASPVTPGQSQPSPQQAPAGATHPVYAADGKTLIGHIVNNAFVPLGGANAGSQ